MSSWRARFGRRDAPPPSVTAVVRQVRFSLKAAHAAEALLFFVAGALAVRSATLVSRVWEADLREAWMLAGCTGLLCAAAWWLEHPVRLHATARTLDERVDNGLLFVHAPASRFWRMARASTSKISSSSTCGGASPAMRMKMGRRSSSAASSAARCWPAVLPGMAD